MTGYCDWCQELGRKNKMLELTFVGDEALCNDCYEHHLSVKNMLSDMTNEEKMKLFDTLLDSLKEVKRTSLN